MGYPTTGHHRSGYKESSVSSKPGIMFPINQAMRSNRIPILEETAWWILNPYRMSVRKTSVSTASRMTILSLRMSCRMSKNSLTWEQSIAIWQPV